VYPVQATLEELYYGVTQRYRITRHLLNGKTRDLFIDLEILPGFKKGTKIRFAGVGNERVNARPQDVVFVIEEAAHPHFTREGSTLRVMNVELDLIEALTGDGKMLKRIRGLGGEDILVPIPPAVVRPGDMTRVPGAGMPMRRGGKVVGKGDLIVHWTIAFPGKISKIKRDALRAALMMPA